MATSKPATPAVDVRLQQLSGLADGELPAGEAAQLIVSLARDEALQRCWRDVHLVGDALRSSEVVAFDAPHFCARVSKALAAEPTVLAPGSGQRARRWALPSLAVAASVAALGFIAFPMLERPAPGPVATAPVVATPAAPAAVEVAQTSPVRRMGPNAGLEVYLTAHRELTGGTAMPRAVQYLRPAAGEDR